MDADVQEKIGYLESVLGQYIVNSDMALSRLERNISNLSREMQAFKAEMKGFKDEMRAQSQNFSGEMTSFKDEIRAQSLSFTEEMTSFKDEMKDFKAFVLADIEDSRADRKAMNKRWGELANKMGTVVEDIVAPCIGGVAREYFQVDELDFFAVRLRKKNVSGTLYREFDVVAESEKYLFVVETKSTPRTSYLQDFIDLIPEIGDWFPQARSKTVIPILSSLYIPEDSVRFLTHNRIFALAMKDDNMDLLNPELISGRVWQ
jgi:hypothetical protein